MELTFENCVTLELQNECFCLAREACIGKYRTNRQPHIACMTDDDPKVRVGGILWSQQLLDDRIVTADSQLLALRASLKFEKHPVVEAFFNIAIADVVKRQAEAG